MADVMASPSPTLSPKSSFHSLRRSSSHTRAFLHPSNSSSSLRQHASSNSPRSPAQHIHNPTQPVPRSEPLLYRTTSTGTQYTPPGLPPTALRSALAAAAVESTIATPRDGVEMEMDQGNTVEPPPEPKLRVDPLPHVSPPQSAGSSSDAIRGESPVKRSRRDETVMPMPWEYMKCDVRALGDIIAIMLNDLVRINDPLSINNSNLTRFHSRAMPGISIKDYLSRLIIHATLSPPILLSMVYYIDRLCTLYPIFNISSLTVHRFLISSATVAAKGLSDSFWTNNTYARVGGISVKELALLELDFLQRMDWKIVPNPQTLNDYYKNLVERTPGYELTEDATVFPPIAHDADER